MNRLLQQARRKNLDINAFVRLVGEGVLPADVPSDALLAVKDNILLKGMRCEAGSALLNGHVPASNAVCVQALLDEGYHVLGKTSMDEFGMGSHSLHGRRSGGPVLNPRFLPKRFSAGGSSGGSAAAVAAGLCKLALGTDTGGSVRLPASYCGIFGFKSTYGRISRQGIVSYASSLDTVGIFSDDLSLVRRAFAIMNKRQDGDMTAFVRISEPVYKKKVTVGLIDEMFPSECSQAARDNVEVVLQSFAKLGATVKRLSLPLILSSLPVYYITAMVEASSCLARYGASTRWSTPPSCIPGELDFERKVELTRALGFGREVFERLSIGAALASGPLRTDVYGRAQELRGELRDAFKHAFEEHEIDMFVCPTAPSGPPSLVSLSSASAESEWAADIMTVPASLAGLPAISIPTAVDTPERTVGVQLIGQHGLDEELLHYASTISV